MYDHRSQRRRHKGQPNRLAHTNRSIAAKALMCMVWMAQTILVRFIWRNWIATWAITIGQIHIWMMTKRNYVAHRSWIWSVAASAIWAKSTKIVLVAVIRSVPARMMSIAMDTIATIRRFITPEISLSIDVLIHYYAPHRTIIALKWIHHIVMAIINTV